MSVNPDDSSVSTTPRVFSPDEPTRWVVETASSCPICLSPWETTGEHRVVATWCGHLYGESCIRRSMARDPSIGCPLCHRPVVEEDLRAIYPPVIFAAREPSASTETNAFRPGELRELVKEMMVALREKDCARAHRDAMLQLQMRLVEIYGESRDSFPSENGSEDTRFNRLNAYIDSQADYLNAMLRFNAAVAAIGALDRG